jgi:hypothetical protein
MIDSLLNICVAVPDLLETGQAIDVVLLLEELGDFEDGALQQFLIVFVDHEDSIFLLLLGHAQLVDHTEYMDIYL